MSLLLLLQQPAPAEPNLRKLMSVGGGAVVLYLDVGPLDMVTGWTVTNTTGLPVLVHLDAGDFSLRRTLPAGDHSEPIVSLLQWLVGAETSYELAVRWRPN